MIGNPGEDRLLVHGFARKMKAAEAYRGREAN